MKYSYNWLKELSGTKKTPEEVAQLLIKHSFEVEEIIYQNKGLKGVIVGEVLEIEKHPNADKLRIAKVNIGSEILTIVCGAKNLEVGQKVPVATIGTILPTDDEKGFKIKKSKIRGIDSNGMICAEDELGVGTDSKGIMVLSENSEVGEKFATSEGLDDIILDIDVLPNRGHDALSHRGMAAEIASVEGQDFKKTNKKCNVNACENVSIKINTDKCFRYSLICVSDIKIKESPQWMKHRLKSLGISPVNSVVDISNYVMLEIGQPSHAYSRKKIGNSKEKLVFDVVSASKGEKLKLLNNKEIDLNDEEVVVKCNQEIVALAGVMGGAESAVSKSDDNIIFEIANFEYSNIRKTKNTHNLQTDAAYRFERDIDLNLVDDAINRIVELIAQITDGKVQCLSDKVSKKQEQWSVFVNKIEIERLLGIKIKQNEVIKILENMGISVIFANDEYRCKIPTIRRDLRNVADIIEEIGRIYGYDKITPQPLKENIEPPIRNDKRFFERNVKNFLAFSGFNEVKSYSFYSEKEAEIFNLLEKTHVRVLNPMSNEYSLMRKTLFIGIVKACLKNLSNYQDVRLFETGRIYDSVNNELPNETEMISLLISTSQNNGSQFYELKGVVQGYLESVGIENVYFTTDFSDDEIELHGSRKALIRAENGEMLGILGELSKKTTKFFGIKKQRVAVCELNLDLLYAKSKKNEKFEQLSKFPAVLRDLSMIVEPRTRVADIERIIYASGGKLLVDVDLFDLYINPKTKERSMAFHLVFSDSKKTLTAKEIDLNVENIISNIEKEENIEVKR